MAVARLLDVRHGDGIVSTPQLNQEHAVNWFRFLRYCASNGLCTIVASQWNGSGENFHDEANPLGENAFIYAEFDVGVKLFGILVQWADSVNFGTAPGNPGLLQGSIGDGVGIQFAIREDGTSPWAGTTGDTGANTKGTPVWTPGGSVVHVFPRSNNPGPPLGSHNTNKENMCLVGQDDVSGFNRAHWVANEDGIFQAFSLQDNGAYVCMYVGRYGVRTGLTLSNPYCMIWGEYSSPFWPDGPSTQYGGTTGNSSNNGGIIAHDADGVMDASIGLVVSGQQNAVFSPNNLISPPEFEGGDISVFQRETTPGLAGFMPVELVAHFYGTSNQQTNAVADRAYIGNNTAATEKWGISWDGGAIPGTNNTRLGRLSYTP